MPENFAELDAVEFVRSIARYRINATGSTRLSNRMTTFGVPDARTANAILDKYAKAQPQITDQEMSDAVDALYISLDYSVMDPNLMVPRIMPNGAILIRNSHRVIALSDSPALSLQITPQALLTELHPVVDAAALDGSDQSRFKFLVIHRDAGGSGLAVATQKLPKSLSEFGQTLICIGNNLDISSSDILKESGLIAIHSESITGMAVLRTFANKTLIYSTYRASNDLDTILEEYSEASFDDLDIEYSVDVFLSDRDLARKIQERTEMRIPYTELKRPDGRMGYYFDKIITDVENWKSYTREKTLEIMRLTPIFANRADRPISSEGFDDYWDLSEALNHKVAIVEVPMSIFSSVNAFASAFEDQVLWGYIQSAGFPEHEARLLIDKRDPEAGLQGFSSEQVEQWINEKTQMLQEFVDQGDGDDEEDWVHDCDSFTISVALIFDKRPDQAELDAGMKRASSEFDTGGHLYVPHIGFSQGYDCGGYDTGNAPILLTSDEQQ